MASAPLPATSFTTPLLPVLGPGYSIPFLRFGSSITPSFQLKWKETEPLTSRTWEENIKTAQKLGLPYFLMAIPYCKPRTESEPLYINSFDAVTLKERHKTPSPITKIYYLAMKLFDLNAKCEKIPVALEEQTFTPLETLFPTFSNPEFIPDLLKALDYRMPVEEGEYKERSEKGITGTDAINTDSPHVKEQGKRRLEFLTKYFPDPMPLNTFLKNEALKWIYSAVHLGQPEAQCILAMSYKSGGFGVEKNEELAKEYFQKSASQGWIEAQHFIDQDSPAAPKSD